MRNSRSSLKCRQMLSPSNFPTRLSSSEKYALLRTRYSRMSVIPFSVISASSNGEAKLYLKKKVQYTNTKYIELYVN